MILDQNGKQLAPCIISKVRDAFASGSNYRSNTKHCAQKYWCKTCNAIGKIEKRSLADIIRVKNLYIRYIS